MFSFDYTGAFCYVLYCVYFIFVAKLINSFCAILMTSLFYFQKIMVSVSIRNRFCNFMSFNNKLSKIIWLKDLSMISIVLLCIFNINLTTLNTKRLSISESNLQIHLHISHGRRSFTHIGTDTNTSNAIH